MKKLLKAILEAAIYIAIYFAWSIVIGMVVGTAVSLLSEYNYLMELAATVESYDELMTQMFASMGDMTQKATEDLTRFVTENAMVIAVVQNILSLATYVLIIKLRKKKFFGELKITRPKLLESAVLVGFGLGANIVLTLILSIIPFPEAWMNSYEQSVSVITATSLLTVIYTVIVAPITEEILFRGLIHQSLKKGMPMFAAMLLSSWIFGLMHGELIWMMYATLLGLLMAWIFEKRRSLTASIVFHMGFNAGGMIISLLNEINIPMLIGGVTVCAASVIFLLKTSEGKISFKN